MPDVEIQEEQEQGTQTDPVGGKVSALATAASVFSIVKLSINTALEIWEYLDPPKMSKEMKELLQTVSDVHREDQLFKAVVLIKDTLAEIKGSIGIWHDYVKEKNEDKLMRWAEIHSPNLESSMSKLHQLIIDSKGSYYGTLAKIYNEHGDLPAKISYAVDHEYKYCGRIQAAAIVCLVDAEYRLQNPEKAKTKKELKEHYQKLILERVDEQYTTSYQLMTENKYIQNVMSLGNELSQGKDFPHPMQTSACYNSNGQNYLVMDGPENSTNINSIICRLEDNGQVGDISSQGQSPMILTRNAQTLTFEIGGKQYAYTEVGNESIFPYEIPVTVGVIKEITNGKVGAVTDTTSTNEFCALFNQGYTLDTTYGFYKSGERVFMVCTTAMWHYNFMSRFEKSSSDIVLVEILAGGKFGNITFHMSATMMPIESFGTIIEIEGKHFLIVRYLATRFSHREYWGIMELTGDGQIGGITDQGEGGVASHKPICQAVYSASGRHYLLTQFSNKHWDLNLITKEGKMGIKVDTGLWDHGTCFQIHPYTTKDGKILFFKRSEGDPHKALYRIQEASIYGRHGKL